ncbi:TonB-dependent receptor [Roseateles chitosanitabidus]|uniref:TonB-dependent receptor n=1 Tax=Roseateles chitosanitabidus TaxID=65048 RepID=UPI00082C12A8|nr:TonB-dependent receptor [Roseateles chitosanitabidus]
MNTGPALLCCPAAASRRGLPALLPLAVALLAAFPAVRAQQAPQGPAPAPAATAAAAPEAAVAGADADKDATARPPSARPTPQVLDVVTISASRRREPARDVPMQVSVISAEGLEKRGAKALGDFLANEPGVSIGSNGGAGVGGINLRGVTTGVDVSATVGVYVDEVQTGANGASAGGNGMFLDMGLLDLHHVEVLRGPQGTLYGASSVGGLIKYVTHTPDTTELSGKVSLGASTTAKGGTGNTIAGVLNVPLKEDVAAIRVAAYRDQVPGHIEAVGPLPGKDTDRGQSSGARISALVTPTRKLSLRFTATTQKVERDGRDFVDYAAATSQPVYGDLRHQRALSEAYRQRTDLFSAEVDYDFGWARLEAISSYQRLRSENQIDASTAYVPLLGQFGIHLDAVDVRIPLNLNRNSQELRLTSAADPRFEWLVGLYIDRERGRQTQYAESFVGGAAGPRLAYIDIPSSYREDAVFGDATWKFGGGFSLTGGLRVARNRQTYVQQSSGLLAGGDASIDAASKDTSRTYLLTGLYALDKTSNVYVRVASGYRPGGPNAVLRDINTGDPLAPPSFRPDELVSTELGLKSSLLDRSLQLEAAIFNVDWKDIQQASSVNGVSVVVNSGKARIRGAEASLSFKPTPLWSLSASASYNDAKLTQDAPGLDAKSGDRLPRTPRLSMAVQAQRNFELAGHPAYAGLSVRHVGERDAGIPGSRQLVSYRMPAYTLTDLQAGIEFGRYSLALYARNVFDRRAQLSVYPAFLPLGGNAMVSVAQPRTLGATLSASF